MLMRRTAALLLLVFAIASGVRADIVPPVVTAKAFLSVTALTPGSDFKLAVRFQVHKSYHIGAATATDAYPCKLELNGPKGVSFDKPLYPEPKLIDSQLAANGKLPVYDGESTIFVTGHVTKDAVLADGTISATFVYQACSSTTCSLPAKVDITVAAPIAKTSTTANEDVFGAKESAGGVGSIFDRGAVIGFLLIFLTGLGLCLTPCVYPMVPVTVGYFGNQSEKRPGKLVLLAACYVVGLAITYSTAGVVAARTGREFGWVLQNPLVPVGIAAVLVVLALSMFGLYELRPPSWIAARSQGKSGPLGALLMGMLFGAVAAPCVGPVTVGLLVFVAKVGNPVFGFFTFFTLALGMGLPLFVLAMFSGSLSRLPRAGIWMVAVKKVFGLLLVGTAVYYVTPILTSVAPRLGEDALPMFIAFSGLYLGWLEPSLRRNQKLKTARKLVGIAIVAVGLFYLPRTAENTANLTFAPYTDDAVAQAAKDGKPVMIDFAATWCAECKELDTKTFSSPDVMAESKRFVLLRFDLSDRQPAKSVKAKDTYGVMGLPTIVFLDSSGTPAASGKTVGFIDHEEMLKRMRMVK